MLRSIDACSDRKVPKSEKKRKKSRDLRKPVSLVIANQVDRNMVLFTVDIARHLVIMHCFAHIFITVVLAILLMVKSIV